MGAQRAIYNSSTFIFCSCPFKLSLDFSFVASLYTGFVDFDCNRSLPRTVFLDPGLPKLGMMISQTRVSDVGPDVKHKF